MLWLDSNEEIMLILPLWASSTKFRSLNILSLPVFRSLHFSNSLRKNKGFVWPETNCNWSVFFDCDFEVFGSFGTRLPSCMSANIKIGPNVNQPNWLLRAYFCEIYLIFVNFSKKKFQENRKNFKKTEKISRKTRKHFLENRLWTPTRLRVFSSLLLKMNFPSS